MMSVVLVLLCVVRGYVGRGAGLVRVVPLVSSFSWAALSYRKVPTSTALRPVFSSALMTSGGSAMLGPEEWAVELRVGRTVNKTDERIAARTTSLFANVTTSTDLARLDALYVNDREPENSGVFRAYFAGAKRLWCEVGEWRRLRVERKTRALTWREERIIHETPLHLARMFPLLVNPLPPPFGFFLIAVASALPRVLLTPQFWTQSQWTKFSTADSVAAKGRYEKVLKECSAMLAQVARRVVEDPPLSSARYENNHHHPAYATQGTPPPTTSSSSSSAWTTPLAAIMEPFEEQGPLGLQVLTRRHLVRLARVARPRPFARWQLYFTRSSRLRDKLHKAAIDADIDDQRLAADFASGEFDS